MSDLKVYKSPPFWLLLLIFVAALLPRATDLGVFLAHDETKFWEWSRQFFFSLLAGDLEGTIVGPGNPSIIPMWSQVLVMAGQYGWAWLNGVQAQALAEWPAFQSHLVFSEVPLRRLPVVLINTATVTGMWWFCHRLFGARLAFLAAILFILDPFFLADSRTGRGEGLLSGFVTLALLSFIFYWVYPHRRYLIFSGFIFGLALLTKMSAVSLGPTAVLISVLWLWQIEQPLSQKIRRFVFVLGGWGLVAIVTFWLLWPALWVAPAKAFAFLFDFAQNVGLEGRTNYYFGELSENAFLPFYYVVVFFLKVTPIALVGLVAFGVLIGLAIRARLAEKRAWIAVWSQVADRQIPWSILLVAIFPIIFFIFMTVGALKRDWYLIPAFPALDIVAAAGLLWLGHRLYERLSPRFSLNQVWASVAVAILVLQMIFSLPGHPLYYTHWNPLVRGGLWADKAVMVGWNVDLGMGAH
ncbi:MAG: glycosyltransferase family 39 protein, partial [Anaerolineae bacterium]|nr:glycosyltransferase family 39 protein [Anaerolineae bacterium]